METTVFDSVIPASSREEARPVIEAFHQLYGADTEGIRLAVQRAMLKVEPDHLLLMQMALRGLLGQLEQFIELNIKKLGVNGREGA